MFFQIVRIMDTGHFAFEVQTLASEGLSKDHSEWMLMVSARKSFGEENVKDFFWIYMDKVM